MELYWQEHKLGLQLILSAGDRTEVMGRIRRRKDDTYDVNARAFGYNPERAATGITSLDEAKAFVESFRPWDEFIGPSDLAVEPDVRPLPDAPAPEAPTAAEPPPRQRQSPRHRPPEATAPPKRPLVAVLAQRLNRHRLRDSKALYGSPGLVEGPTPAQAGIQR